MLADGALPFALQRAIEFPPICHAGKAVDERQLFDGGEGLQEFLFGVLAIGDIALDVNEPFRTLGGVVSEQAGGGFDPAVGAVGAPGTIGDRTGGAFGEQILEELIHDGDVFRMDEGVERPAEKLAGRIAEQLGDGRGDVLADAVEIGENDDVA